AQRPSSGQQVERARTGARGGHTHGRGNRSLRRHRHDVSRRPGLLDARRTAAQVSFTTVLVANRGEIAWRVMRTAKAMGYRTVAVYSDADKEAPHVGFADQAVRLGPPPVGESYLAIDRILDAARQAGADAVHP